MPRAWVLIRDEPNYRRQAFVDGLTRLGFLVRCATVYAPDIRFEALTPEDVLVVWNRYGSGDEVAKRFERAGGCVLVAENGYVGADAEGRQHYSLALGQHTNHGGRWFVGGAERLDALGLDVRPWRTEGAHVLVLPNRPFGPRGYSMPEGWAAQTVELLRRATAREVRLRVHPGNWQATPPKVPLADDLRGAWACAIWTSSAGVHAVVAGVPVIRCAPAWVLAGADRRDLAEVDRLVPVPEEARRAALVRLAWAQWTVAELASGEPFERLLALREPEAA